MTDLATVSVKKIIAKHLNLPLESIVLLRTGGWVQGTDSPAFQNGYANVENPQEFDVGFPDQPQRFQATIAIKLGQTIGSPLVVELEKSQVDEMVLQEPESYNL